MTNEMPRTSERNFSLFTVHVPDTLTWSRLWDAKESDPDTAGYCISQAWEIVRPGEEILHGSIGKALVVVGRRHEVYVIVELHGDIHTRKAPGIKQALVDMFRIVADVVG
jgi:hypothetical protein